MSKLSSWGRDIIIITVRDWPMSWQAKKERRQNHGGGGHLPPCHPPDAAPDRWKGLTPCWFSTDDLTRTEIIFFYLLVFLRSNEIRHRQWQPHLRPRQRGAAVPGHQDRVLAAAEAHVRQEEGEGGGERSEREEQTEASRSCQIRHQEPGRNRCRYIYKLVQTFTAL